jgi:prevent-host-death family protein
LYILLEITTLVRFKEVTMLRTISSSELRAQLKRVLNEVAYGRAQYIVEKFDEPVAAVINIGDYRILQSAKQQMASSSFQEMIDDIRSRHQQVDADELGALVEEARDQFYDQQKRPSYAG